MTVPHLQYQVLIATVASETRGTLGERSNSSRSRATHHLSGQMHTPRPSCHARLRNAPMTKGSEGHISTHSILSFLSPPLFLAHFFHYSYQAYHKFRNYNCSFRQRSLLYVSKHSSLYLYSPTIPCENVRTQLLSLFLSVKLVFCFQFLQA